MVVDVRSLLDVDLDPGPQPFGAVFGLLNCRNILRRVIVPLGVTFGIVSVPTRPFLMRSLCIRNQPLIAHRFTDTADRCAVPIPITSSATSVYLFSPGTCDCDGRVRRIKVVTLVPS